MVNYREKLLKTLKKIVSKYIKAAQQQIRQYYQSDDTVEGNAEVLDSECVIAEYEVAQEIIAFGQKAWIIEYGKGSLMEKNPDKNPFLEDYIHSDNFNKLRIQNAYAITGREAGEYFDLDGNPHKSHGRLRGKNLEEFVYTTKTNKDGKQAAYARAPKRIIQKILYGSGNNGLISLMSKEIQQAMMKLLSDLLEKEWRKEIKIL